MNRSITFLFAGLLFGGSALAQPDLKPSLVYPGDYFPIGSHSFDVLMQNVGSTTVPLNGYKICWQVNNGIVNEALPISPTYGIAPNMPQVRVYGNFMASFPAAGIYKLKVWTRTVSLTDANNSNDTVVKTVKVLPYVPVKNVLMEVFKHQACCPCVEAACYEDSVVSKKSNYAMANIYTPTTDVLYNAEGSTVDSAWNFGHPAILFDRFTFPHASSIQRPVTSFNNSDIVRDMNERDRYFVPLEVSFQSATFNMSTRELKIKVRAKAYDTLQGDMRFNLYLTEDSVKAWQACATPNPNDYYHHHVVRKMCGGPWGLSGSLPNVIYPLQEFTHQFSYIIPTSYNINRMDLIGLVQQYNTDKNKRIILNSNKIDLKSSLTLSTGSVNLSEGEIVVYPNPATNTLFIDSKTGGKLSIVIYEATGKEVMRMNMDTREKAINISKLSSGTYLLMISDGSQIVKRASFIRQ